MYVWHFWMFIVNGYLCSSEMSFLLLVAQSGWCLQSVNSASSLILDKHYVYALTTKL